MERDVEVLGECLPQCHFVHHKSHLISNPRGGGEVGDLPPELWHCPQFLICSSVSNISYINLLLVCLNAKNLVIDHNNKLFRVCILQ
jgi:hypothetical protein